MNTYSSKRGGGAKRPEPNATTRTAPREMPLIRDERCEQKRFSGLEIVVVRCVVHLIEKIARGVSPSPPAAFLLALEIEFMQVLLMEVN